MAKTKLTPFQQALVTAVLEEYADIPAEDEIDLEFSPVFEETMRPLVEHSCWGPVRRIGKTTRRVILVAILLTALATTVLAAPAVREAIVKFFITESKDRFHINFDPEQFTSAPKTIETVYRPTYIPAHYTHTRVEVESDRICHRYDDNEADQHLYFYQYLIPEDLTYDRPRTQHDEISLFYLDGIEIHHFHYWYGREDFVWADDEYLYMISFHVPEEAELFEEIFSSIQPDDSQ